MAFPDKFEERLVSLVNYYRRIFPNMSPVDIPKEVAKYTQDYYSRYNFILGNCQTAAIINR